MLDKRKFYINGQWVDPSTKTTLISLTHQMRQSVQLFLWALKLTPTLQLLRQEQLCLLGLLQRKPIELHS